MFRAIVVALALGPMLGGCLAAAPVARVAGGHESPGRFIAPAAYTAYLEGVLAEAAGDRPRAKAAYERALDEDEGAVEAASRLGAVECLGDRQRANELLDAARARGEDLDTPWTATAECALARGNAGAALKYALEAARIAPRSVEASFFVARALEGTGDTEGALRWLRALSLERPSALPELESLARRHSAGADAASALERVEALRRALGTSQVPGDTPARTGERLESALRSGDATDVRDAAVRAHVTSSVLALRAIRAGRVDLAAAIADGALRAEPGSADARIAALTVADLAGDEARITRLSAPLPVDRAPPNPEGAAALRELLERRIGPDAARAFAEAYASRRDDPPPPPPPLPAVPSGLSPHE